MKKKKKKEYYDKPQNTSSVFARMTDNMQNSLTGDSRYTKLKDIPVQPTKSKRKKVKSGLVR